MDETIQEKLRDDNQRKTLADSDTLSNMFRVFIHDLMNHISVINLNGDLIKTNPDKYSAPDLWNKIEPAITLLEKEISRVRLINRQLLNPAGFKPGQFCFVAATRSVLQVYNLRAQRKSITIDVILPEESHCVYADEFVVRQGIISAILDNAIKFSEKGTRISVEVEKADAIVSLSVQDNGIGIPDSWANDLLHSAEREQFRRRGTNGEIGIGFGLLIAHKLANYFGGALAYKSELDDDEAHTSTVVFELPVVAIY